MTKDRFKKALTQHTKQICKIYFTLVKIMLPLVILIKILDEIGVITFLGQQLSPLMGIVDLPGETGVVWGAALFTNIYGALVVLLSTNLAETLTVAQITTLSGLMLIAHALPIEGTVAKRIGLTWTMTFILRFCGALFFGFLISKIYQANDWLQETNQHIAISPSTDPSLNAWIVSQIKTFIFIFIIIAALLTLLQILRLLKIEYYLGLILRPFLKMLGISKKSSYIIIVGTTLGLSYGGGILIEESDSGRIPPRDVFLTVALLSLLHGLIEDTLTVMLVGAHLSGILWFRLLFSFLVIAFLALITLKINPAFYQRWIFKSSYKERS